VLFALVCIASAAVAARSWHQRALAEKLEATFRREGMLLQELSVKGCTMGEFRQQLAKTSAAFREAQADIAAHRIQKWAAYAQAMSAWEGVSRTVEDEARGTRPDLRDGRRGGGSESIP
jgi:hypothetical protein